MPEARRTFSAVDAATGAVLDPPFPIATADDVERACAGAARAFATYGRTPPEVRGRFLRAMADGLEADGDAIVARAHAETALPLPRLQGELVRTTTQLRLFADLAAAGSWLDARIDTADPGRKPIPRPDVRSLRRPLGPVVVLGASNFPLAFSVAGGDTASALATGNTVIVKAHPAHPGTSHRVGHVLRAAVETCGLPEDTFSLLFDDGIEVASALVRHPLVEAVGFTGSRGGGLALARLAAERPRPIPVFAEMGSANPVIVLRGALRARGEAIAAGLFASFTLGVGQFCTNPGLVLYQADAAAAAFVARLAALTRAATPSPMLTARIAEAYRHGVEALGAAGAVVVEQAAAEGAGRAAVLQTTAAQALSEPRLLDEVFGPCTLLVECRDVAEIAGLAARLQGQLTATLHAEPDERAANLELVHLLERKAGRVIFDQFPTGVEVCPAMVHGGPFPATSDGGSTSVGTRAAERFTRLVAYQGADQVTLPPELRDDNPFGLIRLVDGNATREAL